MSEPATTRGASAEIEAAASLPRDSFAGRVALVTGGGTGLGLELSRALAQLGATVAIASRSSAHHAPFLAEARARGWSAEALELDVREASAVERAIGALAERRGRLDILINNAAGNFVCPAERLSERAWRAVLGIVLDGSFYCSRAAARVMLAQGSGQILNVLATYAWTGMPGVVHSASAKAGVLAMTRTLAAEWGARGLRVNAIAPGPFESAGASERLWPDAQTRERVRARIPLGRFARASEVAAQALWLLSPASAYVNGECLTIDGGASLGQGMWPTGSAIRRDKGARAAPEERPESGT